MSHQISKHTLKRDQFAEDAIKLIGFVRKHSTESLAVGIGMLVIIAGAVLMNQNRAKSEREATLMIGSAHAAYYSGDLHNAQLTYEEIVNKHGSSSAAKEALVYLGNLSFQQRKFDEARSYFERCIKTGSSNPLIMGAAISGMAACFEQTGRIPEAAEKYAEVAEKFPKEAYLATNNLLASARCYRQAQLNNKAKEVYQKIINLYPQTQAYSEARAQLDMLTNISNQ